MVDVTTADAIKAFSLFAAALMLKLWATTIIQARKSFLAGTGPDQDKAAMAQTPGLNYVGTEEAGVPELSPAVKEDIRWRRIVANDNENLPISMIVFISSILVGGKNTLNIVLMGAYVLIRAGHTVAYAYHFNTLRSVHWVLGQFVVLAAALNGFAAWMI